VNSLRIHKDEEDGTFFIPWDSYFELYESTHMAASGKQEKYDIHSAFIDFNKYKRPQAFLKFSIESHFFMDNDIRISFASNQQGDRLSRRHLKDEK
jgi:hypothetical protein